MSFYYGTPRRSPSKQRRYKADQLNMAGRGGSILDVSNRSEDAISSELASREMRHIEEVASGGPGRSPKSSIKNSARKSVTGRRKLISFVDESNEKERANSADSDDLGESGRFSTIHDLPEFQNTGKAEKRPSLASSSHSSRSTHLETITRQIPKKVGSVLALGQEIGTAIATGKSGREVSTAGAGRTIFSNINAKIQIQKIKEEQELKRDWKDKLIIFPMSNFYRAWWVFTVVATIFTFYFETYQIGFRPGGLEPPEAPSSILNNLLISTFAMDMVINFFLAFFTQDDELVYDHKEIALNYLSFYFWIDLIGVMPFYLIVLKSSGLYLQDTPLTQYLSLLRLLRLVRMRRVGQLFDIMKFSSRVSLMGLTLIRNTVFAGSWTHFAACVFYFIAKRHNFDENTWIGPHDDLTDPETYITTLYWSVVTFTTVGYGDLSPVNMAEQIFSMVYMFLNIILMSYIIGSITLLVVKNDEATGMYRDNLQTLHNYCHVNGILHNDLYRRLKTQLKVEFNHRDMGDEMVLSKFPKTMRQKVLYKLYSPCLEGTNLMQGIRQHFITDFLSACKIVVFSSGEELLTRGAVSSDLFLLVEGAVELSSPELTRASRIMTAGREDLGVIRRVMECQDFINEISFFTESPQIDTVRTLTVCKTLIISKSEYKTISNDHPGSVGRLLHNLLQKVHSIKETQQMLSNPKLPKNIPVLIAGSEYDTSVMSTNEDEEVLEQTYQSLTAAQTDAALSSVQDLVEMHINRQKDDHTTRFLFAASRDDIATIRLMCDQGFDPDSCDYDSRTALMVASMKGNIDAIEKLLEYGADPHLKDHHGTCALLEAIINGHDVAVDILLNERTHLDLHWMDDARASGLLNKAVFEGDIQKLKRLVKANVNIDAGDYDKRTPIHIAASEGNMAAFMILVEAGANLEVRDRWGNSVVDDAKRSKHGKLLAYLEQQSLFQHSPDLNGEEK